MEQGTTPVEQKYHIIGSKWVFCIKRKPDGSLERYKARLVSRGFTQVYGLDFFVSIPLACILMANLTIMKKSTCNLLHATTDSRTVKRLRKSLYGLKQAGGKWHDTLVHALTGLGFHITHADPRVFQVCARVGEHMLIIAVHIGDCILTAAETINACYALVNLGPVHWLLGIKITRDHVMRAISLSQASFIETTLLNY